MRATSRAPLQGRVGDAAAPVAIPRSPSDWGRGAEKARRGGVEEERRERGSNPNPRQFPGQETHRGLENLTSPSSPSPAFEGRRRPSRHQLRACVRATGQEGTVAGPLDSSSLWTQFEDINNIKRRKFEYRSCRSLRALQFRV